MNKIKNLKIDREVRKIKGDLKILQKQCSNNVKNQMYEDAALIRYKMLILQNKIDKINEKKSNKMLKNKK